MNRLDELDRQRKSNLECLKKQYKDVYCLLEETLGIMYFLCDHANDNDAYNRVIGLLLTKGILIWKSMYSITIDGHAQESGALLRYLVELFELIKYLREDETRISEVLNDKLPTAGRRAQKINGEFKFLRDYLNKNGSHLNITYDSFRHIYDSKEYMLKPTQIVSPQVLCTNAQMLCTFGYFFVFEVTVALFKKVTVPEELIDRVDLVKEKLLDIQEETL